MDEVIATILGRFWTERMTEKRKKNRDLDRGLDRDLDLNPDSDRDESMNDDDWARIRQQMLAVEPDYSAKPVCAQELANLARVYETLRGTDNRSRMLQLFCECAMKQ